MKNICWIRLIAFVLATTSSNLNISVAQTVMLPTTHTFSLDNTVLVPDQGSAYAGSVGRSYESVTSRGPISTSRGYGRSTTQSNAQVRATIIDLEELDRELREQTIPPRRASNGSTNSWSNKEIQSKDASDSERAKEALDRPHIETRSREVNDRSILTGNQLPSYNYLATLSHIPVATEISVSALEDATYYLEQARLAKDRGHWSAVEVYYGLAWKALPPNRRQAALANWSKPKLNASDEVGKAKASNQLNKKPIP